jgi:hypothetical protein
MFEGMVAVKRQVAKSTIFCFLFFLIYLVSSGLRGAAGQQLPQVSNPRPTSSRTGPIDDIWDAEKYIGIDEIKAGMEGYCLTCYKGTKVEKFSLEVLDVMRNANPGSGPGSKDAILVRGTDERLIRTGPVGGCSGSPVYIDGRLAGALAFAWTFSKEPLYGVTPIGEMLRVGQGTRQSKQGCAGDNLRSSQRGTEPAALNFDFSKPIDFAEIDRQLKSELTRTSRNPGGLSLLPAPLVTSGLPAEVCQDLDGLIKPFGLMVVAGGAGGSEDVEDSEKASLVPGACYAVPWVTGDIRMGWLGTVTEVRGDQIYGFGHWLLGYGSVDLPMATAKIHTVVSNVARSFKLGSPLEIVGAMRTDESAAVVGRIGAEAQMIPLTLKIDRYNDTEERVYNCQVVRNRLLTLVVLRTAVTGAALMLGNLPPDHTIEYKVAIGLEGFEPITFENVSTGLGVNEIILESVGSVALLMDNPYKLINVESFDFDIRILPKSLAAHIWSVDLSDSDVHPGDEIEVQVVVESFLGAKKKYYCSLKMPEDLAPGKYELTVCGPYEYERFLRKAVPYRFVAQNAPSLVTALRDLLEIRRDELYCLLSLPPGGVTVERAELPDLPATKALILQDAKRALRIQPYRHWLQKSIETGAIVGDKKTVRITVEKE